MAQQPDPVIPLRLGLGGYTTIKPLSDEELAEHNRRAEAKRAEIRKSSMLLIGRDEHGEPLPSPDLAEEERLRSSDLRGVLRQAQAEREEIAARLAERKAAAGRAEQHLAAVTAELQEAEQDQRKAADRAAVALAERLRTGATSERTIEIEVPASLDLARHAVGVAQAALDTLTREVAAAEHEHRDAQRRVGLAVLDVVKAELLRIGAGVAAHDRAAALGRANLEQAGFVTGNLQRRHQWAGRIFTSSTLTAMHPAPAQRLPPASLDWQAFIVALFDDAAAELGKTKE